MSPTRAASRFVLEKRLVRAPVGSSMAIWDFVTSCIGSFHTARTEGGGGRTFMRRLTAYISVS